MDIKTFKDLEKFTLKQNNIINEPQLFFKNKKSKAFNDFEYSNDYNKGIGGNMQVFYGKDRINNDDLAVKVEIKNKKQSDAYNEIITLTRLKEVSQIPKFYFYEFENNKNVVAETLFGPSLQKFYDFNNYMFDHILISIIGIQLINILKNIHSKGIIHNDVKPNNICWGRFQNTNYIEREKFFLIDFGYARKILEITDIKNGNEKINNHFYRHYSNAYENKYAGSCEFMAITISEGLRPSRRTDIQELIYTLLFLIKKGLPWSNVKAKNHLERCKKMGDLKKNIDLNILFDGTPQELLFIYKSSLKLDFQEEPDYEVYIILFNNIFRRFGINGEIKQKNFLFGKINDIFSFPNNLSTNIDNSNPFDTLFNGYPFDNIYPNPKYSA